MRLLTINRINIIYGEIKIHLCNEISTHEKHENSLRVEKEFIKSIKSGKLLPLKDI